MSTSDRTLRNQQLIAAFRANSGIITEGDHANRPILILGTTGAKSGAQRVNPLAYTQDGDTYIVIASKGGAATNPDWFHNLVANPIVTVEVGAESFRARATLAEGENRDRLYANHAAERPVFLEYQQRTSRKIPVVILERLG